MTDESKNVSSLFTKISAFRKLVNAQDWSDDCFFNIPNNPKAGYPYLSEHKLKDNLKGLLPECGLEWVLDYSDVEILEAVGSMRCHFKVKGVLRLIDIETGFSQAYTAYGEAADSGDKALRKAQTSALKAIMDNNFLISDKAVDPDSESRSGFMSPADREVVVESMQDMLVEEKHAEKPVERPASATEPLKSVSKPAEPVQSNLDAVPQIEVRGVSPLQEKAIQRLLQNFEKAVDAGERTEEDFDLCRADAHNIDSAASAAEFLKTWKV